jgi:hypothetical protein
MQLLAHQHDPQLDTCVYYNRSSLNDHTTHFRILIFLRIMSKTVG